MPIELSSDTTVQSLYSPQSLKNLPLLTILEREYRQTGCSNGATRGHVASISTWKDPRGAMFLRIHGHNGTRREDFDLNLDEGHYHHEPSGDLIVTMKSGLAFIFFANKASN